MTITSPIARLLARPIARPIVTSGGGVVPFTPADLNPVAWFDQSGMPASGAVSLWSDNSANGNDLTQATGSVQPVITASAINGLKGVTFDGAGDFLQFAASLPSSATCYFVLDSDATGGSQSLFGPASSNIIHPIARSVDADTEIYRPAQPGMVDRMDGAAQAYATRTDAWNALTGGAGQIRSYVGINMSTLTQIANGAASFFYKGHICEIFIASGALTASEQNQLGEYYATKYGITWNTVA